MEKYKNQAYEKYKELLNFNCQSHLLITIDWLTLNVPDVFTGLKFDENELFQVGEYVLSWERTKKTKNFNNLYKLFHDGEQIATIASNSNSELILKGRSHIKLENHLFYNGTLKKHISEIFKIFAIGESKISRLDIAVDGTKIHLFTSKFYFNEIDKNHLYRIRDNDNITPVAFTRNHLQNHFFYSFYVGQMGNSKTEKKRGSKIVRYYNKSMEIRDNGLKKQYILNWYQKNGFDTTKDVYRFEVELNSDYIKTLQGFHITDLFDQSKLQSIFIKSLENLFEFRFNDDSNVTRCTPVEMFTGFTNQHYVKATKSKPDKLRTKKICVKMMVNELLTGRFHKCQTLDENLQAVELLTVIRNFIREYQLHQWFEKVFPKIMYEANRESIIYKMTIPDWKKEYELYVSLENNIYTYGSNQ